MISEHLLERFDELPAPEPVPNLGAYLVEREMRLASSPECARNYATYRQAKRSALVDYLPIRMDFENVSRCNFRCTMCAVSDWKNGRRAADMSLECFKRIIDEQYGLLEVKVQGLGEPTMQGDDYFEMIRYARARHIWVRTTTNASLLHLKDNYRKLVDSGANEIQISIDGATKEVFESIRRQSDFERVVSNCKLINDYCAQLGIERTKMWVVVQKSNRHQMPQFVELSREIGFKHLAFSIAMNDWGTERWQRINDEVSSAVYRPESDYLVALGKYSGIKVSFWNVTNKYSAENLCPWPFERSFISSDLRVVPCCIIANPDVLEIGKVENGRGFTETWKGDAMTYFRTAHLSGNIPKACSFCYKQERA